MMTDILLTNADTIAESTAIVRAELDALVAMTQAGDAEALRAHLEAIRQARTDWAEEFGFVT
jgi:prephenate dehydrogenase